MNLCIKFMERTDASNRQGHAALIVLSPCQQPPDVKTWMLDGSFNLRVQIWVKFLKSHWVKFLKSHHFVPMG